MAISKETLIDWLSNVPNDAQVGIEVGQFGQLDLVAFCANGEQHIFAVGGIPNEGESVNPETNGQQH